MLKSENPKIATPFKWSTGVSSSHVSATPLLTLLGLLPIQSASMSSSSALHQAFAQSPDLGQRVKDTIGTFPPPCRFTPHANSLFQDNFPQTKTLFDDIVHHIHQIQSHSTQQPALNQLELQSKKRKLEPEAHGTAEWAEGTFQAFNDISFSIPQRKKLKLTLGNLPKLGARAISADGETEIYITWADVQEVICLPVPEKAQAQFNFCLLPSNPGAEQIVWTVPETVPKPSTLAEGTAVTEIKTFRSLMLPIINDALKAYRKKVVVPDDAEFASQVVQGNRKGETAYHVKAFRGAKEGFLFLLSIGILWGFKKPLELYPFDSIDSVSYTSVLQRTFNLNITSRPSPDAEPQEIEFSMVDQADFAGINAYVQRHGLQDASMAEQRRAKKLNVNGVKREEAGQDGDDQAGELEKAQREAEDLEDEEEEDYDPGSEGESEGSGDSSEDDEMANGGQADEDVVEELGSETEDIDE